MTCNKCGVVFNNVDKLEVHILVSHEASKKSAAPENGKDEMEEYEYELLCKKCKTGFNSISDLHDHVEGKHNEEETVKCQECGNENLISEMGKWCMCCWDAVLYYRAVQRVSQCV